MKKIPLLVILVAILALTGCGHKDKTNFQEEDTIINRPAAAKDISTYKNEKLNISFQLPSTWRISTSNQIQSLTVTSPSTSDAGTGIVITIPVKDFAEYERMNKEMIQTGKMVISNNYPIDNKSYTFKEYSQQGWLYYIAEVRGKYVGVEAKQYLDGEQQKGLSIILNSLSFIRI